MKDKLLMLVNVPRGVTKEAFLDVINAATAAYSYLHRKPSIGEIRTYCGPMGAADGILEKVYAAEEFKVAMRSRGYDFTDTAKLTPQQVWAVSIITNPTNRRPLKDKLAQAGISYHTYRAWLNQPVFANYIKEIGERLLNDHVQDVHTRVVERAANGDIAAMRLYYDLTGRTDSATNKAVQDLASTVRLLLEVITRNVTDVNVLSKIQKEIGEITDGRGSGNSINDFEFENIIGASDDGVIPGEVIDESIPRPIQDTNLPAVGEEWVKPPIRSI